MTRTEAAKLLHTARAAERADRLDEAEARSDEAIAADETLAGAWVTRGALHDREGQRVSALACYRRALELEPNRLAFARLVVAAGGGGFEAPLRGEVVDLFDRYAPIFDTHLVTGLSYVGHEVLPRTVKQALGTDRAAWRVLDLGCGTGLCGPALRDLAGPDGGWLEGVDLSPACVARAAERGWYDEVWVGDLLYALICAPDSSLDLIVAADVFGYLGDFAPAIAEVRRVLRPGGAIGFTVEVAEPHEDGGDAAVADFVMRPSRRFAYRDAYLANLARANGLEVSCHEHEALRVEDGAPVEAHVVVWNRP